MLEPIANLSEARLEFDRCRDWLWKSLCEFGPTHTLEQVWDRILYQRAFLWTAPKAVIVGEFYYYPSGMRSFNYWLQGGTLAGCKKMHRGIEAWAADHEPDLGMYTGMGRRGWLKAMHGDWKEGYTTRIKRVSP